MDGVATSWPVTSTMFIGSTAVLIGEAVILSHPNTQFGFVFNVASITCALSGAILTTAIMVKCTSGLGAIGARQRRAATIQHHLRELHYLPAEEKAILIHAAAYRTQVFLATISDEQLEPLVAKGYVEVVPGLHNWQNWPHKVPDHVWRELVKLVPEERSKSASRNLLPGRD
ncbi:hypothetical protein [Paracoccus fontiphilus]|uniref:Superinfection exclusion protein B n=1 Tax=Paracoccus fontiphilus TaxID=1815556 RepID=A0ABV7IIM3_9RHOB|nr:hypothetical protein [Paracoccus fontiphilus]